MCRIQQRILRGAKIMKKRKTLPKSEPWHKEYYKTLICQHGQHKTAIEKVNTIFLELLNVEDTAKNRELLGGRMRTVNPNRPECDQETKDQILREIDNRSAFLRSEQDARRSNDRLVLDQIIAKTKNAVLNADSENFNVRDLISLMELQLKIDEQEAKIHGIFKNHTIDNQPTNDFGDKLSHAKRLLENTRETQSTDHREDRDRTHD